MTQLNHAIIFVSLLLFAGCSKNLPSATEPYEAPETGPEKILGNLTVKDAANSTRITTASIEFNETETGRYRNQVMATNGIFQDSLVQADLTVDVYASADGYEPADTIQVSLQSDFSEVIYLTREAAEPEMPGPITVTDRTCSTPGQKTGTLAVTVKNGAFRVALDMDGKEIAVREELSPTADQEIEPFTGLAAGDYDISAENSAGVSLSNEVILACDDPDVQGPTARLSGQADDLTANYDASASSTPNEKIEMYIFDFDNDGVYDDSSATPTIAHTFDEGGAKTTRLKVRDNLNLTDETTIDVFPTEPETAVTACPFDERDGTVVTFADNRIYLNNGEDRKRTAKSEVNLAAGTYTVKLYGYDDHRELNSSRVEQQQPHESFFVQLYSGSSVVGETPELGDLPDNSEVGQRETTIETFVLEADADAAQGVHPGQDGTGSSNSLNAGCAAFQMK